MRGDMGLNPSKVLTRVANAPKRFDTDFDFDEILPCDDDDVDDTADKPSREHLTPSGNAQELPTSPHNHDRVQKM